MPKISLGQHWAECQRGSAREVGLCQMAMPIRHPARAGQDMRLVITVDKSAAFPMFLLFSYRRALYVALQARICVTSLAIPARRLRDTRLGRRSSRVVGVSVRDASWPTCRLYDGACESVNRQRSTNKWSFCIHRMQQLCHLYVLHSMPMTRTRPRTYVYKTARRLQ
jgi:hypothetical protein